MSVPLPDLFRQLRHCAAQSPHPTDKIAAQIIYSDGVVDLPCSNSRPDVIDTLNIPLSTKIAGRSLTVHAETRALTMASRPTQGATLLLTDPFCPNCAKQITMAGIKQIIIDAAGFNKSYYRKGENETAFHTLSLSIAAHYGVDVFVMRDGALEQLHPTRQVIDGSMEQTGITATLPILGGDTITACGLQFDSTAFTDKYDGRIDPATRAFMTAVQQGDKIDGTGVITLSHYPNTPRPFIDLMGAGAVRFSITEGTAPVWAAELPALGFKINA